MTTDSETIVCKFIITCPIFNLLLSLNINKHMVNACYITFFFLLPYSGALYEGRGGTAAARAGTTASSPTRGSRRTCMSKMQGTACPRRRDPPKWLVRCMPSSCRALPPRPKQTQTVRRKNAAASFFLFCVFSPRIPIIFLSLFICLCI